MATATRPSRIVNRERKRSCSVQWVSEIKSEVGESHLRRVGVVLPKSPRAGRPRQMTCNPPGPQRAGPQLGDPTRVPASWTPAAVPSRCRNRNARRTKADSARCTARPWGRRHIPARPQGIPGGRRKALRMQTRFRAVVDASWRLYPHDGRDSTAFSPTAARLECNRCYVSELSSPASWQWP